MNSPLRCVWADEGLATKSPEHWGPSVGKHSQICLLDTFPIFQAGHVFSLPHWTCTLLVLEHTVLVLRDC